MSDIKNIIRQLVKPDGETVALVCTVDEVYKDTRTIDCTPINEGAPLLGVNLQANQEADYGICVFPEKGSYVIVGFVADGAAGVVLTTEKIESAEVVIGDNSAIIDADGITLSSGGMSAELSHDAITLNGGNIGGLVDIQRLTQKLNELVDSFNSHTHAGTCPAGAVSTDMPALPAKPFAAPDYEDTTVIH